MESKNKKVMLCSGIFPPDIGGPAHYVPLLSNYLIDQGYEVKVFCYSDELHDDSKYGFKVIRFLRNSFKILRELRALIVILNNSIDSDVVYANGHFFKSFIVSKILGKRFVAKVVGDESWERLRNKSLYSGTIDEYQSFERKTVLMKLMDWFRSFPLTKADKVIVPSFYLKRIVSNWSSLLSEKVYVVYNAFDLPDVQIKSRKDTLTHLVTVCRLVNWKGVDKIIKLLSHDTDLSLTVVGGGPLLAELKKMTIELGVEERVQFTGDVSKTIVAKCLNDADIFILNSVYEGLPHVVLEAMSLKLPVIATDVGGTGEVVKNEVTGLLINPNNESELFQAVLKLKSDPEFAARIAGSGYDLVCRDFSAEKMLKSTEELLLI